VLENSFSEYAITVNAYGIDGGYTPSDMAFAMDTNPSDTDDLSDKSFGSPNEKCAASGPGMGVGGEMTNCEPLGNVLIIQGTNSGSGSPYSGGGKIVFSMAYAIDELNEVVLFNAQEGATIIVDKNDGSQEIRTIDEMEPNAVVSEAFSEELVVKITVQFEGVGAVASIGICHDTESTPAPHGFAPPVETSEPSALPTTSPEPSASPSLSPIEGSECPEDVELVAVVGETQYPDIPIIVVEQSTEKVTFKVRNSFTETLKSLYVQFHEGIAGDTKCYPEDNVPRGEWVEYTAYCMKNCPITIVDLWAEDESFNADGDNAIIPECCEPVSDHSAPIVQYTFKIHCDSQCPDTYRRQLVEKKEESAAKSAADLQALTKDTAVKPSVTGDGSQEGYDRHFCMSDDYPCGENSSLVYVCHYSAREGYQTFCVPEADSDVMSFYPKDYCGPCVGGYGNHITS
jgi:hypothetical protein